MKRLHNRKKKKKKTLKEITKTGNETKTQIHEHVKIYIRIARSSPLLFSYTELILDW